MVKILDKIENMVTRGAIWSAVGAGIGALIAKGDLKSNKFGIFVLLGAALGAIRGLFGRTQNDIVHHHSEEVRGDITELEKRLDVMAQHQLEAGKALEKLVHADANAHSVIDWVGRMKQREEAAVAAGAVPQIH